MDPILGAILVLSLLSGAVLVTVADLQGGSNPRTVGRKGSGVPVARPGP